MKNQILILILALCFKWLACFKTYKNWKKNEIQNDMGLVSSFKETNKFKCIAKCNRTINCLLISFNGNTCKLYNKTSLAYRTPSFSYSVYFYVYCDPNPCQNGGTCENTADYFKCLCMIIYKGITCNEMNQTLMTLQAYNSKDTRSLALTSSGFASGYSGKEVDIWSKDNKLIGNILVGLPVFSLLGLSQELLACGVAKDKIIVYNNNRTINFTITSALGNVNSLIDLGNGLFASGSSNNLIVVWKKFIWTQESVLNHHSSEVKSLVLLKNGHLASSSADNTIKIWNISNYSLIATLSGHLSGVNSIAVTNNGDLVSGSYDKTIKIWNTFDYSLKQTISVIDGVVSLIIMPNSDLVTAYSLNQNLEVRDTLQWTLKKTHNTADSNNALLVSSNGELIVGTKTSQIFVFNKLWNV